MKREKEKKHKNVQLRMNKSGKVHSMFSGR
jgi:hypothetical protein